MAPLKLGYAHNDGFVNKRHLSFYEKRSQNIGAITIEPLYLDPGLREIPSQLGIDNDDKIPGLSLLVNQLHKNEIKAIAHLNHPGRMANPKIPGNYFVSSTDKPCENGGAKPEIMNHDMMDKTINSIVEAAQRTVNCGFDIIELQFGHGYLLAQFLSPAVNNRSDQYNGILQNRARFPLEVLNAVKKAVKIPVIARISGDEMMPEGFHIEEMIEFSLLLEKNGINAIHVSAGSSCSTPPWFFQHMFVKKGETWEFAAKIKAAVKVPVIFVGQINTVEDIHLLENKYHAEYIALGRPLVADPEFIGKFLGKVKKNIRPCLGCSEGCLGNVRQGKGLGCVVNPYVNIDIPDLELIRSVESIAVVGGGLAGMQAAILLKERGFKVTVFEKNQLGGQFNLAYLPPKKENLKKIIDYYVAELSRLKIPVIYKEVKKDDILNGNFDRLIIATGAIPVIPPIKGLKEYYWTEFLNDDQLPKNETVLIVGGGLIAMEMASKLIDGNNQIIIVEMLNEIGRGMETMEKSYTLKKLYANETQIYTRHKVIEIIDNKVFIENDTGMVTTIEGIVKIIIAAGMKSYIPFHLEPRIPVYYIGDAKSVGKAENAIYEAYKLALTL
ncbi:MAG: FAD-dependent oxidoreductase [Bacteroidales bacterium]|nr:FAD-dependent oxidoreductase [Bacteroidales bacterium]